MAKRAQVIETLAPATGMSAMTLELILRYLSSAGLIPRGRPGHRSEHFTAEHLKNVLIALAAYQPVDVVEVVRALDGLLCSVVDGAGLPPALMIANADPAPESMVAKPGVRFGDWLVAEISFRATPEGTAQIKSDLAFRKEWGVTKRDITMCTNPPSAWVSDLLADFSLRRLYSFNLAGHELTPEPEVAVRRLTTLMLNLLQICGDLLADTIAKQSTPLILNSLPDRSDEGLPHPETTKAAQPGSSSDLQSGQPAIRAYPALAQTAPVNKAQSTRKEGRKQSTCRSPRRKVQVHHQPAPSRTQHDPAHWANAAPPQASRAQREAAADLPQML